MNRFAKEYVRYVDDDAIEILSDERMSNLVALQKIRQSIRIWYFRVQKQMMCDQHENHEFSTFEYYTNQGALVRRYEKFNAKTLEEWQEDVARWKKKDGIDKLKSELIENVIRNEELYNC